MHSQLSPLAGVLLNEQYIFGLRALSEFKEYAAEKETSTETFGKGGGVVIPVAPQSNSVVALLSPPIETFYLNLRAKSPDEYLSQLGTSIIKLEVYITLDKAIDTVYQTKLLLGDTFAGAIAITTNNKKINLFHYISAAVFDETDIYPNVTTIIMFTYKNLEAIKEQYGTFGDNEASNELAKNAISLVQDTVLASIEDNTVIPRVYDLISNDVTKKGSISQKFRYTRKKGTMGLCDCFIVAHQLLTNGTYVPYYGTSLILRTDKNVSAAHISGNKSCNINAHNNANNSSRSVCTGSSNNREISGLQVLHHAYLGSAYLSDCMTNVSYFENILSIEKSIELYAKKGIITVPEQQQQEEEENIVVGVDYADENTDSAE